jgi:hypothetical protein
MTSSAWTGGFIRLTRVMDDGADFVCWIRAASIFHIMASAGKFISPGQPDKPVFLTVVTAGYQGVMYQMNVRENPDMILAMTDAILKEGAVAGSAET